MIDSGKVTAQHLRRDAYLYVRQSTLYQVANNTESTRRQYDLRGRAVALGWPAERVVVIDDDQCQSGSSATDRAGFQRLVADVSLGRAGIVLGLECSRLARNNADWHRLLQLCSFNSTLICDEDGLYDPCTINDRLLLGLKGTMSEAELHFIRARLQGGILAKAARGELVVPLPVGLVYDAAGKVCLDPDAGVRQAIEHLFTTFAATGSATATVKAFSRDGLSYPGRHLTGPHAGELYWKPLRHDLVLFTLHNPRYAGAYCYGRRRHVTDADGRTRSVFKPRAEWITLIPDAHAGYIGWEQYEANPGPARRERAGPRRRPPRRPAPRRTRTAARPARLRQVRSADDRELPPALQRHPRPRLLLPTRRHRHRHRAVPEHGRRRHRRRRRRLRPGRAHPARDPSRDHRQLRTRRPGRRRRPHPRHPRRTGPPRRRCRPPPLPRRRPRQPARR